MTDAEIIGIKRRFRDAMRKNGITRKRLAQEVGATPRAIWGIYSEKGGQDGLYFPQVTVPALLFLAKIGVDTNEILLGEVDK